MEEPIAFGIRRCPYCREETPDYRIDCLSCGEIFPEFREFLSKQGKDGLSESQPEENNLDPE
jgi:hypothetical protein